MIYNFIGQAGILVVIVEYELVPTFLEQPNSKEKNKVPRNLT